MMGRGLGAFNRGFLAPWSIRWFGWQGDHEGNVLRSGFSNHRRVGGIACDRLLLVHFLGSSTPDVASPSDLRAASGRSAARHRSIAPLASAVASPARRCG